MNVAMPGLGQWSPPMSSSPTRPQPPPNGWAGVSDSVAHNKFHQARSKEAWDDRVNLGMALERFTDRLGSVSAKMRAVRPDLADANYDLQLKGDKFVVVDDTLDERSRIWLEESFSGDRELVRLARAFNDESVLVFDTHGGGPEDCSKGGQSYDRLGETIDRSTRFISLIKEIASTVTVPTAKRAAHFFGSAPFMRAASLVEKQIINDTYAYQAKGGTVELMRNVSGLSWFGWSETV